LARLFGLSSLATKKKKKNNQDASSTEEADDERRRLVRAHPALDREPHYNPSMSPTDQEVYTILEPWRPPRWRLAAGYIRGHVDDNSIWLRTYYPESGDDKDNKMAEWIAVDEDWDPMFEEEDA